MTSTPLDRTELRDWIVRYIADLLKIDASDVDLGKGLEHYGLDSADAVILGAAMEERFGIELDPGVFIEFSTFRDMVDLLGRSAAADDESGAR